MMGEAEERKFVESKNDEKYIAIEFVCKSESCQAIEYLWQAFVKMQQDAHSIFLKMLLAGYMMFGVGTVDMF